MNSEQIVTRAYVLNEDNTSYILEYYIFSEETASCETLYGVSVKQNGTESLSSKSKPLSKNKNEVIDLIYKYAKNFVFPSTLEDLINDYETK